MNATSRAAALAAAAFVTFCGIAGAATIDDVRWRGLLDVTASNRGRGLESNLLNAGDTQFDAYRLRLFAEGEAATGVQIFTQVLFTEIKPASMYGAYAMLTPWSGRDLHLLAGKIPWNIGTYGPRTYSDKKPLVGTPMMYQYQTSLSASTFVPDADALLALAGTPARGMQVVYDACWDFGAMATGSVRPVEFAVGVMNGTPGSPKPGQDSNDSKTVLGRIGVAPFAAVRVGVSGAYGAYLPASINPALPAGTTADDYHQKLVMADADLAAGRLSLIAEGYLNTWETPRVGDLQVAGYYVEGRLGLNPGAFAAIRWESMRFDEIRNSSGTLLPWDHDVDRMEAGAGYRIARAATLKGVYQRTSEFGRAGRNDLDLYAVQLSLGF